MFDKHLSHYHITAELGRGGFLAYQQRNDTGTLVVRQVNPETGEFLGPPREALGDESTSWGQFSVTADGDLLYRTALGDISNGTQSLFHIDLQDSRATVLPLVVPDGSALDDVVYSPDGSRLAFIVGANNEFNLVVYDMEDETLTQISFGFDVSLPSWSSDGNWLYYSVSADSSTDIYRQNPVASSTPELVLLNAFMGDTSPDGRYLAFSRPDSSASANDFFLMVLDLETAEIRALDAGPGYRGSARFSPDGKYVVYEHFNNDSFILRVVSMEGFRISDISDMRGRDPRWSAAGDRIYLSGQLQTHQITVRTSPSFNVLSEPELLFTASGERGFDVSPNGESAIIIARNVSFGAVQDTETGTEIIWLQNWSAHLKREFTK